MTKCTTNRCYRCTSCNCVDMYNNRCCISPVKPFFENLTQLHLAIERQDSPIQRQVPFVACVSQGAPDLVDFTCLLFPFPRMKRRWFIFLHLRLWFFNIRRQIVWCNKHEVLDDGSPCPFTPHHHLYLLLLSYLSTIPLPRRRNRL